MPKKGKSRALVRSQPRRQMNTTRKSRARDVRPITTGSSARSWWRFYGGRDDHVTLRGEQVVLRATTSEDPLLSRFELNPANARLFPSVAGLAGAFQYYRFRSVKLVYKSGCPATRSGSLAMAVDGSIDRALPSSEIELSAYDCSTLGSVADDMSTPMMDLRKDKGSYLISAGGNATSEVDASDPTKRLQAVMYVMTSYSVTADDSLHAGYVSLEFDLELWNPAPQLATSVTVLSGEAQVITGQSWGVPLEAKSLTHETGFWDWAESAASTVVDSAKSLVYNGVNSLAAKAGSWIANVVADLAAVAVVELHSPRNRGPRHTWWRKTNRSTYRLYADGTEVKHGDPLPEHVSQEDSKTFNEGKMPVLLPMAAGDVTFNWLAFPLDGSATTAELLAQSLYSAGTGALTYNHSPPIVVEHPSRLAVAFQPTGTEQRTVNANTTWGFSMSDTRVTA